MTSPASTATGEAAAVGRGQTARAATLRARLPEEGRFGTGGLGLS